jgi:hypothetical protein
MNKLAFCSKGCPGCGMIFGPCDPFEKKYVVIPYQRSPKGFDTEEEAIEYQKKLLKENIYSMHSESRFYKKN